MSENQEPQKRSFVSEKDAPPIEKKDSPVTFIMVNGKQTPLLKPDIVPTLLYGKLCEILDELKALNQVFSKASAPTSFQHPVPQPIIQTEKNLPPTAGTNPTAQSTEPLRMPMPPTEQTPRVKEILVALEPVKDLLKIDTEGSAMFVMVKPAQFLGPENFAKVASIIRAIGGQYVSAGKNSHFEISKAPLRK